MASSDPDGTITLPDLSHFKNKIQMVKSEREKLLSQLREKPEKERTREEVKHLIKLEDHLGTLIKYQAQLASVSLNINELTTNKDVEDAVDGITHTLASLNNEFSLVLLNGKFDALWEQKMKVDETSNTISDRLSKMLHKEGEDERANGILEQLNDESALNYSKELPAVPKLPAGDLPANLPAAHINKCIIL